MHSLDVFLLPNFNVLDTPSNKLQKLLHKATGIQLPTYLCLYPTIVRKKDEKLTVQIKIIHVLIICNYK